MVWIISNPRLWGGWFHALRSPLNGLALGIARGGIYCILAGVLALSWLAADAFPEEAAGLRVSVFRCDVSPPLGGQPLIWLDRPESIEDPLWAKGIVLDWRGQRFAVCAVDWCGLCNSSYELFQKTLAAALETSPENVFVHTVHQHTAPYVDGNAQKHMSAYPELPLYVDQTFLQHCAEGIASAAKESLVRMEPCDRVGFGQAVVHEVASSRRVRDEKGNVVVRYSSGGKDPRMRELPEGRIDPHVRTITLARGDRPLVRLHFYATHPQSFYGDHRVSADVPGIVRERLENEEDVFQIYLTGCAGDVTFGKYNNGSREARDALASRLYDGIKRAIESTRYSLMDRFSWRFCPVVFPARKDPGYAAEDYRRILADATQSPLKRTLAAVSLGFFDRAGQPFMVQGLRIGPAVAVFLPGEALLEYQEYAVSRAGEGNFVAVAAYGDLGTGYICYDAAFQEGGYEPTASHVAPGSEAILRAAISQVLGALQQSKP